MKYTIIRDTREQIGWEFEENEHCLGVVDRGLKTGDYSLEGYEDIVCIERKRSVEEIATNIGLKGKQFEAEMQRMENIKHSFIICEFNLEELINFPKSTSLPRSIASRIKINGKFLLRRLIEFQMLYNVKVLFCGSTENASLTAQSIFKRVLEQSSGEK